MQTFPINPMKSLQMVTAKNIMMDALHFSILNLYQSIKGAVEVRVLLHLSYLAQCYLSAIINQT